MNRWIIILFACLSQAPVLWAQEEELDRFGRPKSERVTTGGLSVQADVAGLWMKGVEGMSCTPGIGTSLGGWVDFKISEHVVIQCNLMMDWERNTLHQGNDTGSMKTMGMVLPFYVLGRWDTPSGGIWYAGSGPYSEFVLQCETNLGGETFDPYKQVVGTDTQGNDVFALNNHNAGLSAKVAYEFPFHLQLYCSSDVSISNIFGFDYGDRGLRPYKFSIGVAYHFR